MGNIKKVCKEIVIYSLEKLNLYSDEALDMIMKTGQVESGYDYLRQVKGPAVGFWQMEPATMFDIWENYVTYRVKYKDALRQLSFNEGDAGNSLLTNLAVQAAFCRLHYRRVPAKLPAVGDIKAQAAYWKKYYNTVKGKGTVEHFIKKNGG